jgi:membrane protein DedA with SNARE-associated domain
MGGLETTLIDAAKSLFDSLGWAGIVVAMAIESACIPFPSEIIMPLAGWMIVAERDLGWQGVLLASFWGAVGNLIGSTIAYWVGAWGGRPLIWKYGKYVLITRKDLVRADEWFAKYGEPTAFFSRLLPVVRTFVSFPAGVTRMNFGRFAAYSFAGAFIWCIPLTAVGYHWGPKWEQFRERAKFADYPIALIIAGCVAWFVWHRLREIRAENANPPEQAGT